MTDIRCDPLELPTELDPDGELTRADLVFYGVDHAGASYEALVYLDAQEAALGSRDASRGFVGSFSVFGHAGCFGDEGHCLPADRYVDDFDRRPPHPLQPLTKTVIATDAIRDSLRRGKTTISVIVITVVPEAADASEAQGPRPFELVRLLTYQG